MSSSLLSKKLGSKNVKLSVWDKARGAGGRMSTSRSPGNSQCITDLGAQFISAKPEYKESHEDIYDDLILNGLLQEQVGDQQRWVLNDDHHYGPFFLLNNKLTPH